MAAEAERGQAAGDLRRLERLATGGKGGEGRRPAEDGGGERRGDGAMASLTTCGSHRGRAQPPLPPDDDLDRLVTP
uniref:Uncharacterized protein n=2 Tax=Oryza sativa subsp. japonica TaxID=39947 RepID=Q53M30_ORYSJ|nr:hypothetical protein [Oryza sativa Japonica Group]AAX95886.1 hypothetical protein LOC_Os11g13580 [Oryza sativa Japonica Group]ABA92304.1 hypothetical protein LOC_Os11g13580 [Oryza sativa Japonica Group]